MIVFPDVQVYGFSERGRWEQRNDWSQRVNENLLKALRRALEKRHYAVQRCPVDSPAFRSEMDEIQALYGVVNKSIRVHAFGPQLFPHKLGHFEYSLGDMETLLHSSRVDSLVFLSGFHQVRENSRRTGISMAMADSSGSILWYCMKVFEEDHDLRDPNNAARVIEKMLSSLPLEPA
jgi:hypothetical protein